jgi:hypothetical protein
MKAIGLALRALLALTCGVAGAGMVAAQPYPAKPIKLILPFGIGSPPDSMGRLVGQCLSGRLGQSVVIENRPGAGSTIATRAAATADPDGYTLLQVNSAFAYAQVLYPNPGYDPGTSFTPVAALASWSLLLVVNAELPVNTVRELVDYAKAHPGKVSIGHTLGSPPQVLAEMFTKASGAAWADGAGRAEEIESAGHHRDDAQRHAARCAERRRKRLSDARLRSHRLDRRAGAGRHAACGDRDPQPGDQRVSGIARHRRRAPASARGSQDSLTGGVRRLHR